MINRTEIVYSFFLNSQPFLFNNFINQNSSTFHGKSKIDLLGPEHGTVVKSIFLVGSTSTASSSTSKYAPEIIAAVDRIEGWTPGEEIIDTTKLSICSFFFVRKYHLCI